MAHSSSSSPKLLYPEWQETYLAALLELDREKLLQSVTDAETAIYKRLQAISQDGNHAAERQAIEDAVGYLRFLKRDTLGFPDWERK